MLLPAAITAGDVLLIAVAPSPSSSPSHSMILLLMAFRTAFSALQVGLPLAALAVSGLDPRLAIAVGVYESPFLPFVISIAVTGGAITSNLAFLAYYGVPSLVLVAAALLSSRRLLRS